MAESLGAFEQAILVVIVGLRESAYGRTIFHQVQECLRRNVSAGAVYTTLERLEHRGLIRGKLEEGPPIRGGRPRRYYSVTPEGVHALNNTRKAMTEMWKRIEWPVRAVS